MVLAAFLAVIVAQGCSEQTREGKEARPVPLSDGLYFRYDVVGHVGSSTTHGHETYTVESAGPDTYTIQKEHYTHMPDGSKKLIMERLFVVNQKGIVEDCELRSYIGGYSPLWIPVESFEVGDHLRDAGMKVFEKTAWKAWDTYRISDKPDSINFYYELSQGFLVGTDGTGLRQDLTLAENNAGLPTSY